jgi:hypothetical protein
MARLLGQLRCGRCEHEFLPEYGAETSLLVVCPACGASHANTEARPGDRDRTGPLAAWAERHWVDDLPDDVRTPPPLVMDWTVEIFTIDSISCGTMRFRNRVVVLAAVVLPPGRTWRGSGYETALGVGGIVAKFASNGGDTLSRFADDLRASGAEPVWPLEEVAPRPTSVSEAPQWPGVVQDDAADARLESRRITCDRCGAPYSLAALVADGARCPYCAASQNLAGELAEELALYHRRARVAHLHVPIAFDMPAPAVPAAAGVSALACVVCGAPGLHRAGATNERCRNCQSLLVPSTAAMARAVAGEHAVGKRAYGGAASAAAQRSFARRRREFVIALLPMSVAAAANGVFFAFALLSDAGDVTGPVCALLALGTIFGAIFGGMALYALIGRWRRRDWWRSKFAPLAEQLGAAQDDDLSEWAARFWGDRIESAWLVASPSRITLTFVAHGFPVAMAVDIVGTSPGLVTMASPAHAVILLGTSLPRDAAVRIKIGEPARLANTLARGGFNVELRAGGIAAHANAERLARLRGQPGELAILAPVAYALTKLAHALREPTAVTTEGRDLAR